MISFLYRLLRALCASLRLGQRLVFLVFDFPFDDIFAVFAHLTDVQGVYEFCCVRCVVEVVLEGCFVLVLLGPASRCVSSSGTHFN